MTTPNHPQPTGGEPQWGRGPGQGGPPGHGEPAAWPSQQPPMGSGLQAGPGAYPAAPGAYPAAPGAYPSAPGAAKPSKGRNVISIIVLVVILAGLGIFAYLQNKDSVANAEVGDCVHVNSSVDFEVVDCGAAQAQYKVVDVVEDLSSASICDINSDVDYAIEITGESDKSLCLQTWLQVGDCVAADGSWAECGSAESSYEVIEVLEGTLDDTGCPDPTVFVRVYAGENNVICLAEPA